MVNKVHTTYHLERAPSEIIEMKRGKINYIQYPTTEHMPKYPITTKDNKGNLANVLKDVQMGDSIIFEADPTILKRQLFYIRDEAWGELEVVVDCIEDSKDNIRTIKFHLNN